MQYASRRSPFFWTSKLVVLGYLILCPACQTESTEEPSEIGDYTEILWDSWGVPHIFATDSDSLFLAGGWAQMKSHGNLILRLYGEARGRAAEYWGEGYLNQDLWIRTVGIPVRADEWYAAQADPYRRFLEAFTAGMNGYAEKHPNAIDEELRVVLPVKPSDVLGHIQRVLHFTFIAGQGILKQADRQLAATGSNGWAIAPDYSESGNALLLANPHLPWSGVFLWNEMHLVSPDVNFYGAALVGMPFIGIGFNENLGWTHTVNTIDAVDLYELKLVDDGYRWEGSVQPFRERTETLKVRNGGGSFREESLRIRQTVHGPVIAESRGQAIAIRVAGLYQTDLFAQYWEMARASDLTEFESALSRLQMPLFTVIYADRDGHILSVFGGLTPVRPGGDWDWRGVVPGDSAATLWTETHVYGELPRVLDPEGGWVQNANDPPWTTTLPPALDPNRFPAYLAPRFLSLRAQRSVRMLREDARISLDELVQSKNSTRMELADRVLNDLLSALAGMGGAEVAEGMHILKSWDRSADAESRGALLFETFWKEYSSRLRGGSPFAEAWDEQNPLVTPAGLADPVLAAEALVSAAESLSRSHGSPAVPWGQVHRLKRGNLDLPASGGPGELGIFRVLGFSEEETGVRRATGGDSFIAAVEFSNPLQARVLNVTGASSDPSSPHYADQMELYARKELRPAWLTRSEVERHLESLETVDPEAGRTTPPNGR